MRRRQATSIALLCVALLAGPLPARSWLGLTPPPRPQPVELSPLHLTGSVYQGVQIGGALWLPHDMPDGVRLRGLSGLAWSESEQVLYAVSDFGWLFRMQAVFTKGQLTDVRLLDSHPLTDAAGRPVRGKWRDAEGLSFAPGPDGQPALYVSFERVPRITRIDTKGRWQADVPLPAPFATPASYANPNAALEALAWHPRRGLLSAPEFPPRDAQPAGHTPVFSLDGRRYPYLLHTGPRCALVALDTWVGDEMLSLERCYDGNRLEIALRRFTLPGTDGFTIRPDSLALLRLQDGWLLDNFEGMTRIGARGLLLVSDDNDSTRQRTLLMYLERVDPPSRPAAD